MIKLKEILTDANFEFSSTGLKVIAMDSSHTVLVHLKLESGNSMNLTVNLCFTPLISG